MMKGLNFIYVFILFSLLACTNKHDEPDSLTVLNGVKISADTETEPVASREGEDAADDPAIWLHPLNPLDSRIIGTNKKAGLVVYDLDGNEIGFYPLGRLNNTDVRYNFNLGNDSTIDIVGASNRTDNTILILGINSNGELMEVSARSFVSSVDEVYGFCLYYNTKNRKHYAFINGKDGIIEQWEMYPNDNYKIDARKVREFRVDTQPEGMVADDENGILYVGEEGRGIWKFNAFADADTSKEFIAQSDTSNKNISYDIEGLSLYYGPNNGGYLIASSQGNYSYAIFERGGDNNYITSFSISEDIVDAVEETDGLAVSNASFGDKYQMGLLVVQDGYNYEGDSLANQNFKYVDWRKVAQLTQPELLMDTTFSLRALSEE